MRYFVEQVMYHQLTLDGDEVEVVNHYEVTLKELAVLMGSREAASSLLDLRSIGPWRLRGI